MMSCWAVPATVLWHRAEWEDLRTEPAQAALRAASPLIGKKIVVLGAALCFQWSYSSVKIP